MAGFISRKTETIIIIAACIIFHASIASAAVSSVPPIMHYQANVTDSNGLNVDGEIDVEVWIYDSATEGVSGDLNSEHLLYSESHDDVQVSRGQLRIGIGEGTALGSFSGASLPLESLAAAAGLYVELYLNGERIEPRQRMGYRNYALRAQYAAQADSLSGNFSIPASSLPFMPASKVYGTIPLARIPEMIVDKISGVLNSSQVPTLDLDKITTGKFNNAVIGAIGSEKISSEKLPIATMPTDVLQTDSIHLEAGTVSNNGSIQIPPGYGLSNCAFLVGLSYLDMPTEPAGLRMADDLLVYTNSTTVKCEAEYEHYPQTFPPDPVATRYPCTAAYLLVCVK